jgi:hypothetical protein
MFVEVFAIALLSGDSTPLDLQPVANVSIKEGFSSPGFENNNFGEFDTQETTEGGVKFKFGKKFVAFVQQPTAEPGAGSADEKKAAPTKGDSADKAVDAIKGIKVGRDFKTLHVIHSTQHHANDDKGVIGWYVLRYKDGSRHRIPIEYGRHVVDWWVIGDSLDKVPPDGSVFWEGENGAIKMLSDRCKIRLFRSKFENPKPDLNVDAIDIECAEGPCKPFVFGMSVQ